MRRLQLSLSLCTMAGKVQCSVYISVLVYLYAVCRLYKQKTNIFRTEVNMTSDTYVYVRICDCVGRRLSNLMTSAQMHVSLCFIFMIINT